MSEYRMPRGATRFVFIHPRMFWDHWMRPMKAKADRSGLYRIVDKPETVVILSDQCDPDDPDFVTEPTDRIVETEIANCKASGERSLWLEWWSAQKRAA